MTGAAKLGLAAGIAVLGVGAAVYSAWSLQRRPASPPSRMTPIDGTAGGGVAPSSVEVRFGPEVAERLGMTEDQLAAKAQDLLAKGVRPEDLGRELGLGDAPLSIERRAEGPAGRAPEIEPPPSGPFEFLRPDSAVNAAKLEGVLETRLEEVGASVEGIDVGRGDARDIAQAARLALVAPAQGRTEFAEAVATLGGTVAPDGSLMGSAVGIADILEGASLDPTKVRVKGVETEEESRIPMPRRAAEEGDPAAGGGFRMMMRMSMIRDDSGIAGELATMTMPVEDVWPDAADEVEDGVLAVEARAPVRLKNLEVEDGRAEIGVVMVRERGSRTWQPVRYNLYVWDGKAARTFARAIQEARRGRS